MCSWEVGPKFCYSYLCYKKPLGFIPLSLLLALVLTGRRAWNHLRPWGTDWAANIQPSPRCPTNTSWSFLGAKHEKPVCNVTAAVEMAQQSRQRKPCTAEILPPDFQHVLCILGKRVSAFPSGHLMLQLAYVSWKSAGTSQKVGYLVPHTG